MKIYTKPGSKERLIEMFQRVNKINLNENFGSTNTEISQDAPLEEAKPFILGEGYTHFATDNATGKIVTGWDYKGYDQAELRQFKKDYFYNDLKDMGVDPKTMRIVTRHYLESTEGIDPSDTNNWLKDLPTYGDAEKTIDSIPSDNGTEMPVTESTDQERYENVTFMQGDDAVEPLKILNNEGPEAALEYLKQWHNYGEHEGTNQLSQGSSDETFEKDGYIMSWNAPLNYIGLQYDTEQVNELTEGGMYKKATRYNKDGADALRRKMLRRTKVSKKINEHDVEEPNEKPQVEKDNPGLYPDGWKEMDGMFMGKGQEELDGMTKTAVDQFNNPETKEFDDKLPGGIGDNAGDQKFSADQIRKGLKVEMEHTDDPLVAMDIVIDHLTEDENYYGDDTQDPEQAAQCGAMTDANSDGVTDGTNDGVSDGVNNPEDKEETDILLGFKPHNVGDSIQEYDNYNYPAGADADPRAPWHEKDEPDDGKDHSDDEFEDFDPEPEGDVYRNRYEEQ